jgi:hypothetical protein
MVGTVERVRIPVYFAFRVVPSEDNLKDFIYEKREDKIIQKREMDAAFLGFAKKLRAINREFIRSVSTYAIPTEIGWITLPTHKQRMANDLEKWKSDLMKLRGELIEFAEQWKGKNDKYYEKAMKLARKIEKYTEASDVIEIDFPKKSLEIVIGKREEEIKEAFQRYAERMKVATPKERRSIERKIEELKAKMKIVEEFKDFVRKVAERYGDLV